MNKLSCRLRGYVKGYNLKFSDWISRADCWKEFCLGKPFHTTEGSLPGAQKNFAGSSKDCGARGSLLVGRIQFRKWLGVLSWPQLQCIRVFSWLKREWYAAKSPCPERAALSLWCLLKWVFLVYSIRQRSMDTRDKYESGLLEQGDAWTMTNVKTLLLIPVCTRSTLCVWWEVINNLPFHDYRLFLLPRRRQWYKW